MSSTNRYSGVGGVRGVGEPTSDTPQHYTYYTQQQQNGSSSPAANNTSSNSGYPPMTIGNRGYQPNNNNINKPGQHLMIGMQGADASQQQRNSMNFSELAANGQNGAMRSVSNRGSYASYSGAPQTDSDTQAIVEGTNSSGTYNRNSSVGGVAMRGGSNNGNNNGDHQCDCGKSGCGPLLANNLAYFGAAVWFIAVVNVKFMPNAPFPVIGNALPADYWLLNDDVAAVVPLLLWSLHFVRRFTEVLFVHKYTRRMPCGESIGASVYYWGFGFWIGYSANFHIEDPRYYCPSLWILVPGMVLFVVGEVGNCAVHVAQRRMRLARNRAALLANSTSGDGDARSARVLPSGPLFRLVSCPNYTFEIVTWVGFALAVFTLAAALFLFASTITVLVYGYKKHKAYKEIFDGEDGRELYPKRRKAVIPFIF